MTTSISENIIINKQVIFHNGAYDCNYNKDDSNKLYDFGVLKIKIDEKCGYTNKSEKLIILTIIKIFC
mgnify:CR=1 FL=1